jgi:hypothetical protein
MRIRNPPLDRGSVHGMKGYDGSLNQKMVSDPDYLNPAHLL